VRTAIVDTNVFVAGLITRNREAPTARIVDGMLSARFPFLLSVELLGEYREVLLRSAIRERHGLGEEQVDRLLAAIAREAIIREPRAGAAAPDPDDQHVWNLLAGDARALLVTGDRRLQERAPSAASVVSPEAFVRLLVVDRR
jgi:putative PIN family toxin of toxin-antitoxin system